jgi:hypothetical protein
MVWPRHGSVGVGVAGAEAVVSPVAAEARKVVAPPPTRNATALCA